MGEVAHRGERRIRPRLGRQRGAGARPAVTAIDPDRRQPEALGGHMVVEQALGDVEDAPGSHAVGSEPVEQGREVAHVRLVRANLLGGDDPVERDAEAAIRCGEQVVVAIRQDAEPEAGLEPGEGRRGIQERRPVGARAAEGRRLPIGDGCPETRRDRTQPTSEDLAIGEVWPSLKRRLGVGVGLQELVVRAVNAVGGQDWSEASQEAGLPVDQGAVAVEGQCIEGALVDFSRHPQIVATSVIGRRDAQSGLPLCAHPPNQSRNRRARLVRDETYLTDFIDWIRRTAKRWCRARGRVVCRPRPRGARPVPRPSLACSSRRGGDTRWMRLAAIAPPMVPRRANPSSSMPFSRAGSRRSHGIRLKERDDPGAIRGRTSGRLSTCVRSAVRGDAGQESGRACVVQAGRTAPSHGYGMGLNTPHGVVRPAP